MKKSRPLKDFLIVVQNDESLVARLSFDKRLLPLEEEGKNLFWNNNPGTGTYLVKGRIYEADRSASLKVYSYKSVDGYLTLIREMFKEKQFIISLTKGFSNTKELLEKVKKEEENRFSKYLSLIVSRIMSLKYSTSLKDKIIEMVQIEINSLDIPTKKQIILLDKVFKVRKKLYVSEF